MFDETQSVDVELFRHFFARLFDSEFLSSPGQLKVLLGGVVGILASLGGILAQVYYHKYLLLHQSGLARAVSQSSAGGHFVPGNAGDGDPGTLHCRSNGPRSIPPCAITSRSRDFLSACARSSWRNSRP